jgi:hypothetical protein
MKIGGAWVGWGLGDESDEIARFKAFMRGKFSYAKALTADGIFDDATLAAVLDMQRRYVAAGKIGSASGIIDWRTKVVSGFLKPAQPVDTRPLLFTVCGTGVPWWGPGPDSDVARAVEGRWRWQPVGYPAQPFPMNPSVQAGRLELIRLFELHRARIEKYGAGLIGFSQGAIVICETWLDDVLSETGRLRWAKSSILKAATFGSPMREAGKVWADEGALPASPTSHGIADRLMVNTPTWWRDYAHKGDLYAEVEGDAGEFKTAIYKIVMGARIMQGPDSILAQVLELTQAPATEAIAAMQAILKAGMFFVKGTGPHLNYDTRPAIDHLLS